MLHSMELRRVRHDLVTEQQPGSGRLQGSQAQLDEADTSASLSSLVLSSSSFSYLGKCPSFEPGQTTHCSLDNIPFHYPPTFSALPVFLFSVK